MSIIKTLEMIDELRAEVFSHFFADDNERPIYYWKSTTNS